MLKLLLKLYPERFVQQMGENWLIDSKLELAKSKERGLLFLFSFWIQAVFGNLRGAITAHGNEWGRQMEAGVVVVACGQTVMLSKTNKEGVDLIIRSNLINTIGAVFFGYIAARMFNNLYVNSGAEHLWGQLSGSLMSAFMIFCVIAAQVGLAGAGVWLAWRHRIHGKSFWTGLPSITWFLLAAFMAGDVTFMTAKLLDLGSRSRVTLTSMEEHPETMRALGFKDEKGGDLEWRAEDINDNRCVRANAVLDIAKARELRSVRASGEALGLILVRGMAESTWSRGCMTDQQLLAMEAELFAATPLTPQQQRNINWMASGLAQSREELVSKLDMTAQRWCVLKKGRELSWAGADIDAGKIEYECSHIPGAEKSILSQ